MELPDHAVLVVRRDRKDQRVNAASVVLKGRKANADHKGLRVHPVRQLRSQSPDLPGHQVHEDPRGLLVLRLQSSRS